MGNINQQLPADDLTYLLDALKSNIMTTIKVADIGSILEVIADEDSTEEEYEPPMQTETEPLHQWIERTNISGIKYGEQSSAYFWNSSYNPNATFGLCLPNCTTYAYGRVLEAGCDAPVSVIRNAKNWPEVVANGWSSVSFSEDKVAPGDILVWSVGSAGHVAVCESINPIMISASDYTDDSCDWPLSGHRNQGQSWKGSKVVNTTQDISDVLSVKAPDRFFRYGSLANESSRAGAEPTYILKNPGTFESSQTGGFFNNTRKTYICQSITNNLSMECKAIQGLNLSQGDLALILFLDTDFRDNLAKARNGETYTKVTKGNLHDTSYGIIIGKL